MLFRVSGKQRSSQVVVVLFVGYVLLLVGSVYAQSVDDSVRFRGEAGSQPRGSNQVLNTADEETILEDLANGPYRRGDG